MDIDVIVIGGGAAGISAALWCDELKLKTLLLEASAQLGGQLLRVYNPIKNHLGIEVENGRELRDIFVRQIENYHFAVRLQTQVAKINLKKKSVTLENDEELIAKAIIVATGVRRRKLNVEGEEKFAERGIIQSGKRDADSLKGKNVCIVGGGDAALENALILAEKAEKVYLVHRRADFRGRTEFLKRIRGNRKIEILTEWVVERIGGGEYVERVETRNLQNEERRVLPVEAVLIRIGVTPNTEILRGEAELDRNLYVKINSECETSVKGVFAVGDVANPVAPTVSSAVGMGATAAKAIFALLNSSEKL